MGFHKQDEAFHETFCHLSGHGHVWPLIQEQKGHLDRVRCLAGEEMNQMAYCEHRDILNSLANGNMKAARKQMKKHLAKVREILPQVKSKYPELFIQG